MSTECCLRYEQLKILILEQKCVCQRKKDISKRAEYPQHCNECKLEKYACVRTQTKNGIKHTLIKTWTSISASLLADIDVHGWLAKSSASYKWFLYLAWLLYYYHCITIQCPIAHALGIRTFNASWENCIYFHQTIPWSQLAFYPTNLIYILYLPIACNNTGFCMSTIKRNC